ncbi:hypothetical protein DRJ58_00375 [Candidatus Acetothermia bacterium]|nr:MAG: hypothetical protein DRJ58_00375 [Candidatus Acetothermia bacterium]
MVKKGTIAFTVILALAAVFLGLGGCGFLFPGKQEPVHFYMPALSPDGTKLVYLDQGEDSYEIFLLDLTTGEEKQLTDNSYNEMYLSWSPDGKRIAFMAAQEKNNLDIFVLDVETGEITRLTTHSATDVNPNWSASGRIVFNSDRDDEWAIYAIDPDDPDSLERLSPSRPKEKK